MVRRALGYIARTGPATAQDRWEENEGINPFTLAVCIAALVAGAALLPPPGAGLGARARRFLERAISRSGPPSPTAISPGSSASSGIMCASRRPEVLTDPERGALRGADPQPLDGGGLPGDEQIGTEFLQLVRFGLRGTDDPTILASLRITDALLKTDTPNGPVWHRYRGDGYGEHADGRAYDGTGIGRGWPLLTGERGHYELVPGNDPLPYLEAMAAMASPGGMIPEQVWDADPIPARRLFPGRPTGSAMPLAWAHAEFVKLLVSRQIGHPLDRPRAVWERYAGRIPSARYDFWWPHAPIASRRPNAGLAIALPRPAVVHWGVDGWHSITDTATSDPGLDFHVAVLDAASMPHSQVDFTWRWRDSGDWHGSDYTVTTAAAVEIGATEDVSEVGDAGR